jgi:hypothetical protein
MSQQTLDEILSRLNGLPEGEKALIARQVLDRTKNEIWMPNIGPQSDAYFCRADVLLYGGQGGGGKTDLIAGLALTQHQRTLLLRPQYTDLGALIERVVKVAGTRKGLNSAPPAQFKFGNRVIDFGAAAKMDRAETWQGNPHELLAFDEACQFTEEVVRFLMGWNRAADETLGGKKSIRVRTVMASNPPLGSEGEWIIGMFRPWLDLTHPDPAEPGELRWFITDPDGNDLETDDETPIDIEGTTYVPKSRTFIPAALSDNPFLQDTGYQATLDAMPEPLRSAIRDGNFMAARDDDTWQVIPTNWVLQAHERWREGKPNHAMTSIGLDVARGGKDNTVFAPRYGAWFDDLQVVPGRETPDGTSVSVLCAGLLREGAVIGIDNIGIGADAETALRNAGLPFEACNGAEKSTAHTRDGSFGFTTYRSEMWWMVREALDPQYGFDIALPPDAALQADLTTPTYQVRPGQPPKIYVEAKQDCIKRLGRSPDRGDAVVYAWASGGMGVQDKRRRPGDTMSIPQPAMDYDIFHR